MNISKVGKIQKQLFAWGMSKANNANGQNIKLKNSNQYNNLAELKQELLNNLTGKILEIGPGAGANFAYYAHNINWIGVEPNSFMNNFLHQEAEKRGLKNIQLFQGSAEKIPVENNSIDAVVSTHVLCSVQNIEASLQEIKRILKPGGKFVFIEHVAGKCCTVTRKIQNTVNPIWKTLFDNCHVNRETWTFLEEAGFSQIKYHHFQLSFPIVSPHIAGEAII